MRLLLVPLEIEERCSLAQAVKWAKGRTYPVAEEFEWFVQDAFELLTDSVSQSDLEDDPEFRHGIEETRLDLFSKLRSGQIVGKGRFSERSSSSETVPGSDNPLAWDWVSQSAPEIDIPREDWRPDAILWDRDCLQIPRGVYVSVSLSTAALFREFPELPPTPVSTEARGKYLLFEKRRTESKSRGPKPIHDWAEALIALGRIVERLGGIPDKQASLEAAWQDWFIEQFGDAPSISSIRRHIVALYQKRKRLPPPD